LDTAFDWGVPKAHTEAGAAQLAECVRTQQQASVGDEATAYDGARRELGAEERALEAEMSKGEGGVEVHCGFH
jgi:hypothetical protein